MQNMTVLFLLITGTTDAASSDVQPMTSARFLVFAIRLPTAGTASAGVDVAAQHAKQLRLGAHGRGAVGGLVAGVLGDTRLFVSGGAEHQGPDGGGLIAVVAEKA